MSNTNFELLTQAEAARLARCTIRFLQLRRAAGDERLEAAIYRIGARGIRYERGAFVAWLQAQRIEGRHP
jgi:hypothetical protein